MSLLLIEAGRVLCLAVVAGIALPMIFPKTKSLRQILSENRAARLKAMVHLRDHKDDLQMMIKRMTPSEVTAMKRAAYARAASGEGSLGAFEVPRWPTEQKPHLLLTLQALIKTAEREMRLLFDSANNGAAGIGQIAASNPFKLLACQCRIESIKAEALACIPDLEIEAEGLVIARQRFIELFAFGLSHENLSERFACRPLLLLIRFVISVLQKLCFLRSNGKERLEIKESRECNKKIKRALAQWRHEVMPQMTQVCSVEVGFTCESVDSERV